MVGGAQNAENKHWFRCTRCHHMMLIVVNPEAKETTGVEIDVNSATPYDPQNTFTVGESIFHAEWNEFGKVLSKTRTSDGSQAIVVHFEKLGQRTLIEKLILTE